MVSTPVMNSCHVSRLTWNFRNLESQEFHYFPRRWLNCNWKQNVLKIFNKAYSISPHCRYSIAAVVGGVDSEPAKWQDIHVPPRYEKDNIPIIGDISKENGTVSFELKRDGDNANCKVCRSFHEIMYISLIPQQLSSLLYLNSMNAHIIFSVYHK